MKAYLKSELAMMAGVSTRTFGRWISRHEEALKALGVSKTTKLLPPKAVKFVCEEYGIDLDDPI